MEKSKVLYQGILFPYIKIQEILRELGYSEEIIAKVKKEAHMTCRFRPTAEQLYDNNILGRSIEVRVVAAGELYKDGELTNIGLKIMDNEGISSNEVAHITCWVGKKGKAVETALCDFSTPLNLKLKGKFAVFNASNEPAFSVEQVAA